MSISEADYGNNCKTAFSLHVVESASDDYNFYCVKLIETCRQQTDYQLKRATICRPSTYHIHKDRLIAIAVAAKVLAGQLSKDSLVGLTWTENLFCKTSITYKRSEIRNELLLSKRSFPSINQFSNKLKRGCP